MKKKVIPKEEKILEINEDSDNIKNNMKIFYKGWKEFVFKKDVINIAFGMIVATSFKNLVSSLVNDIIMPLMIGIGVGKRSNNLFLVLVPGKTNSTYNTLLEAEKDGAVTFNYGSFINVFIDLIIVSLFLYLFTIFINRIKKQILNKEKKFIT
tara:strand:- start:11 stop:469 length:459 start_codon:yes stop_codon:yes gene_type:complete